MVTCKEDLIGTCIKVDSKEEADTVAALCAEFGIKHADWSCTRYSHERPFAKIGRSINTRTSEMLLFSGSAKEGFGTVDEYRKLKPVSYASLFSRNKEVYEKVDNVKAGDLIFVKNDEEYTECLVIGWHPHQPAIVIETGEMIGTATLEDLHRKVNKPIEWWEDAAEFLGNEASHSIPVFEYDEATEMLTVSATMHSSKWIEFTSKLNK